MKRYKPLIDKMFWIISIPTLLLMAALTVIAVFDTVALIVVGVVDLAVIYLLVSPLFGYVELREESLYIKYGLILKKEIPYSRIRGAAKERRWYADSMLSLKNALDHVNIKHNSFDVTTVSLVDNDEFIEQLNFRITQR